VWGPIIDKGARDSESQAFDGDVGVSVRVNMERMLDNMGYDLE
jgi:hypothetical protein